jgi:hypothetical protein
VNHETSLSCRCGRVRGRVRDAAPAALNRVMCYCRDCRAFARWLERTDLLAPAGGVDIVQVARGRVAFDAGVEELRCLRLSDKGLHRFYVACCRTPMGNSMPKVPFLGLAAQVFQVPDLDALAGRAVPMNVRSATAPLPGLTDFHPLMWAHATRLIAGWWLRGLGGDTFFDRASGAPRVTPRVLTPAERARLAD